MLSYKLRVWHRISLLCFALILIWSLFSLPLLPPTSASTPKNQEDTTTPVPPAGDVSELEGILTIIYGDPLEDDGEVIIKTQLIDPQTGNTIANLQMGSGLAQTYYLQYVRLQVARLSVTNQADGRPIYLVQNISPAVSRTQNVSTPQLFGAQAFINLLCRFSNVATTPYTSAQYAPLFSNTYPGLNHYWQTISYGNINIDGTTTISTWVTLPQTREYYTGDGYTNVRLSELLQDCANAADHLVNFQNFIGINIMLNSDIGCCAWGGGGYITNDGGKMMRVTWNPPWAQTHSVLGHEMGHAFGFPHSTGPAHNPPSGLSVYVSHWDVMSAGGTCANTNPPFGCIPAGTIGYHLAINNWIPENRRVLIPTGTLQTVTLRRLQTDVGTGIIYARVPINNSPTHFYTVEVRQTTGYDVSVPNTAVIIHRVNTQRSFGDGHAMVVSSNNNVNDGGAQWVTGETYTDSTNNIQIQILSNSGSDYTVRINNNAPPPPNTPLSLNLNPVTATSVRLNWTDNSNNESGFNIYRWNGATYAYLASVGVNSTTYTDYTVTCETYYAYLVRAYNGGGESGNSNIVSTTTSTCPPSNDLFVNATSIPYMLPYSTVQNPNGSTVSASDPNMTCLPSPKNYTNSVWYRYTPTVTQEVIISTLGSNYDTVLAVYTGTENALTQIACNDDAVNVTSEIVTQLNANTTYHILVSKWGSVPLSAPATLNLSLRTNRFIATNVATLREAINQANNDGENDFDVIYLNPGNYTVYDNVDAENAFPVITSNILIEGNHQTIQRHGSAPNMRMFSVAYNSFVYIFDLTLQGGNVPNMTGGAIQNNGWLYISNSHFRQNHATWGGAIFNWGSAQVWYSTFVNNSNSAVQNGYAGTQLTLRNNIFAGNSGGGGAAVRNWGGYVYINGGQMMDNAADIGGGISNSGSMDVFNLVVNNNYASYRAGGIENYEGNMFLQNVMVLNNTSNYGGGIYNEVTLSTAPMPDIRLDEAEETELWNATIPEVYLNVPSMPNMPTGIAEGTLPPDDMPDVPMDVSHPFSDMPILPNPNNLLALNQVTVQNNSGNYGGGMYNWSGNIIVTASTFTNNRGRSSGGGIINGYGTFTLHNSSLNHNSAFLDAGAIYNSSTMNINNVVLFNNTAEIYSGGGILNYGTLNYTSGLMYGQHASGSGGAIANYGTGIANITGVLFSDNSAYYNGAAITNGYFAILSVEDSQFQNNSVGYSGGAIYNSGGNGNINNSQFIANYARYGGGAITSFYYDNGRVFSINNSLFEYNSAADGGAIFTYAGHDITDYHYISNSIFRYNNAYGAYEGAPMPIGGVYADAPTQISGSCFYKNRQTALYGQIGKGVIAQNNWWGSDLGYTYDLVHLGDRIRGEVNATPFSTTPLLGCDTFAHADLNLSSFGGQSVVAAGGSVTYTATVTHVSGAPDDDVAVIFSLPSSSMYLISSDRACFQDFSWVVCSVGGLSSGQSDTLQVTIGVPSSYAPTSEWVSVRTTSNEYRLDYAGTAMTADPNTSNNLLSHPIIIVQSSDLGVYAEAEEAVFIGDNFVYDVWLVNFGLSDANNVTVTVNIPANTPMQTYGADQGSFDGSVWTVGDVPANYALRLQITAKMQATLGDLPTLLAEVSYGVDYVPENNQSAVTVYPMQEGNFSITENELLAALNAHATTDMRYYLVDFSPNQMVIFAQIGDEDGQIVVSLDNKNGLVFWVITQIADPMGGTISSHFSSVAYEQLLATLTLALDALIEQRSAPFAWHVNALLANDFELLVIVILR